MSELDRRFLDDARISPSQAAKWIGKSRQAVCKGLSGEEGYFRLADFAKIAAGVAETMPDRSEMVEMAISRVLHDLAQRIGARSPWFETLFNALARAQRIWLVLPAFPDCMPEQPLPYQQLFDAIDARGPETSSPLEVIVFCDRGRTRIEERFGKPWFDEKLVAVLECELVRHFAAPIVVVDPHIADGIQCYTLTHGRFAALGPGRAARWFVDFSEEVTKKVRQALPVQEGQPFNARVATAAGFLSTQVDEI